MNPTQWPRSFLFVPAADERLIASGLRRPCDVVILDLEDGTHPSMREQARASLQNSLSRLREAGKRTAVRINKDWLTAVTDLRAALGPSLDFLILPKVEHPRDVQTLAQMVGDLEREGGLQAGHVRFLLQIESAAALPHLYAIASASERIMGMMLGSEDFSLDCGCLPSPEALLAPSLMVLHAARAAGIQPIGFVASIADLGSEEQFREVLERARTLGFRGAVVVHPKFVDVVNACYTPTDAQVAEAKKIVAAFRDADAKGLGAIKVDNLMVDKPVYWRAVEVLNNVRDQ
jgi:citrate lyase subunit beta/citryl-CoA lyase